MDEKKEKKDVLQGTLALMVLKDQMCSGDARLRDSPSHRARPAETCLQRIKAYCTRFFLKLEREGSITLRYYLGKLCRG